MVSLPVDASSPEVAFDAVVGWAPAADGRVGVMCRVRLGNRVRRSDTVLVTPDWVGCQRGGDNVRACSARAARHGLPRLWRPPPVVLIPKKPGLRRPSPDMGWWGGKLTFDAPRHVHR